MVSDDTSTLALFAVTMCRSDTCERAMHVRKPLHFHDLALQTLPEIPGGMWPSMSLPALLPAGALNSGIDHLLPPHTSSHQDLALEGLPVRLFKTGPVCQASYSTCPHCVFRSAASCVLSPGLCLLLCHAAADPYSHLHQCT